MEKERGETRTGGGGGVGTAACTGRRKGVRGKEKLAPSSVYQPCIQAIHTIKMYKYVKRNRFHHYRLYDCLR